MRFKVLAILLLLAAAVMPVAPYSVTLTNGYVIQQPAGTTIETDNSLAVRQMTITWRADGTATVLSSYPAGTVSGSTFTASGRIGERTTSFDTANGSWSSSDGTGGTIAGVALTNAKTTVEKNWRNQNESFHTTNGIIVGSQVAW
jgi:hypothetical protein